MGEAYADGRELGATSIELGACLLALLVLLLVLSASNRVGDPFVSARVSDQPSMESVNRFLAQGVDPFDPEGEVDHPKPLRQFLALWACGWNVHVHPEALCGRKEVARRCLAVGPGQVYPELDIDFNILGDVVTQVDESVRGGHGVRLPLWVAVNRDLMSADIDYRGGLQAQTGWPWSRPFEGLREQ